MRIRALIALCFPAWFGASLAPSCGSSPSAESDAGIIDSGVVDIDIDRERSLVWIDERIVDDPTIVGLARVMAAISDDGHGGTQLANWFQRFATTPHSERLGPALLIEELASVHGSNPSTWNLDALPFKVTGVHNRLDLGPRQGDCGELRVSMASTHEIYAPLHIIFLFRQVPEADDIEGEVVHCQGTARRWAELSELTEDQFVEAADSILGKTLTRDGFLLAESVELTVSPWEWRQWRGLENPALFQTVDTPRLNEPGPLRDDFLLWAAENAGQLASREIEIPERFRAQSARVPPGVPRERLDLEVDGFPGLADEVEIIGCPSCHTEEAEFIHTTPQRTFSDFYDAELDARAEWLRAFRRGETDGLPPFGPLQAR